MAVTGTTGFVGGQVVRALRERGVTVRPVGRDAFAGRDPMRRALSGVTAVVHCVSAVAGDPAVLRRANVEAAQLVVDAVGSAGSPRLVALSTAAVTGPGPHRGVPSASPRPASAVSRTRAEGERLLLGSGAVVVRPNLVWGAGDRWVVPTLAALLAATEAVPDRWRARVSAVGVRDLARGIAGLAAAGSAAQGTVLHADAPGPLCVGDLARWIRDRLLPPVGPAVSGSVGPLVGAGVPLLTGHQRTMLEVDNWFDGAAFWQVAGVEPGPAFAPTAADTAWYRDHLRSASGASRP